MQLTNEIMKTNNEKVFSFREIVLNARVREVFHFGLLWSVKEIMKFISKFDKNF